MKNVLATLLFSAFSFFATGQESNGNISVTVNNVLNTNGKILASLHVKDTFMKGPGLQNISKEINGSSVIFSFDNVAPGEYSIIVLHDENNNQRMDYDTTGMPMESYGTSSSGTTWGPPEFSSSKFEMGSEDLSLQIHL
jgi:uncharacterized protein (DUF2141 family)